MSYLVLFIADKITMLQLFYGQIKIQYSMRNTHHFVIHDDDSDTNFILSELPVKRACGYNFCDYEEPSTRSENSDGSQKHLKNAQTPDRPLIHAKDDLANELNGDDHDYYHESAIRKHIVNMENAYSEHKIDVAHHQVHMLKKLCEKTLHRLAPAERKLISQIQKQMHDVVINQKILNQKGWELQTEKKNIRVSTIIEGSTVGVLVQANLDVEIQKFLSIIIEIDLMKKVMPFMDTSSLEKIVARNCRIGHCINNFPIISKRQSFFQGIGYDRMQHNKSVFMYSRSLNQRPDLQKELGYEVHETEGAVQLDYKYLIIEYKPESPTRGTLKLAINVDMKLSVPMFIMKPATTGFGIDFYTNVVKIAKNFKDSEWQKKVKNNPAFFQFVQQRIKDYFHTV